MRWLFCVRPLAFAIYLALPDTIDRLLGDLWSNGTVGEPRQGRVDSYDGFLRKLQAWMTSPWWVAAALGFVLNYWFKRPLWSIPGNIEGLVPDSAHVWLRAALIPIFSPVLYGAFLSTVRLVIALVFTARLFRSFHLRLSPLHPDQSGGLGALGRLFTVSILLATALGAVASAISLILLSANINPLGYMETVLTGAVYLIFTPLILVCWLWLPHRAMVDARDRDLQVLADTFQQAMVRAVPPPQADSVIIKAGTDQLTELKRRYDFLREVYPTWPVHVRALRGLIVTSILPLVTPLISPVTSNLSGLFREAVLGMFNKVR